MTKSKMLHKLWWEILKTTSKNGHTNRAEDRKPVNKNVKTELNFSEGTYIQVPVYTEAEEMYWVDMMST